MFVALQEALQLAALPTAAAVAALQERTLATSTTALEIARHSLEIAGEDEPSARQLLVLANAIHQATSAEAVVEPWLHYAAGRLAMLAGDLADAESMLATARSQWDLQGETIAEARSALGLTQILAMQGRFDAAESTIRTSIQTLAELPSTDLEARLISFFAQQNLATLLSYQERHSEALATINTLHSEASQLLEATTDEALRADLRKVLGEAAIDAAVYLGYLDQPERAIDTLRSAIDQLTEAAAFYDRGRAHVNLGHLYTRTARYAAALREFDDAMMDILGTQEIADSDEQRWRAADVLFLEQAIAHLSLNLLPEASADLDRAIPLFAQSGKQYEWGQAIYYRALLALQQNDTARADQLLNQAADLFTVLDNRYWLNYVQIARAHVAEVAGAPDAAQALLDQLLQEAVQPAPETVLRWDASARCTAALLAVSGALRRGDRDGASAFVDQAAEWLERAAPQAEAALLYPHLSLRILHARGRVARARNNHGAARQYFQLAVESVERQRASLPIEEFRTAFLADKNDLYADLALSMLDEPQPTAETLDGVFAVVERARSRVLLERLLAVVDEAAADQAAGDDSIERGAAMRQRLAWLYNQLLSEQPDSRAAGNLISDEIRACEAILQRLERRVSPWLAEAEPATLRTLQAALGSDEQALVYYRAGDEWMVFVVTAEAAQLVRRLCGAAELNTALADLRFQLGRVEVGEGYATRHAARLLHGARSTLQRLHDLLIAPVTEMLQCERLLIVPYGSLHLTPFHALWDGSHYLLEQFEVAYAPSASVEVVRRQRAPSGALATLAAFALRDSAIPQAEHEVRTAANHFATVQLFIDADANGGALRTAAANCDVLHFATHGLFRPDNPFFSALKLADGWVDVHEIYRLPLRARLVILSACESGAVQVQGADEAIGLVRGFLGAGAQSLIVSLWNVHDASAAQIMAEFYTHLIGAKLAPAAALRAAQRHAIDLGRHPYYWAPYAAIG
jgi:CHAT domain-containing protein/tetratricopeptide (TPR) repeat protein